jgi:hypothetical protein
MNTDLDLGCQDYIALKYHMEEALAEHMLDVNDATCCPSIALFSQKYYNEINNLDYYKIHDYCFIGSINSCVERRQWVIDFAKKYFTSKSLFINTDNNPDWKLLGEFDYSHKRLGYCPKNEAVYQSKHAQYRVIQENLFYFQKLRQSTFVLCPGGDAPWSFRFYEVLMSKSIPIVESWHHTYRTKEEANIKYNYILSTKIEEIEEQLAHDDLVDKNTLIFEHFHLLH